MLTSVRRAQARAVAAMLGAAGLALLLAACDEGGDGVETAFAEGREVFRRCTACHVTSAAENKVGPHLVGLFGRPAGAVEGFRYSEAMRTSGIIWTDETLRSYLRDPRRSMPGNRMAFPGIRRDEDMAALLAYLRAVTTPD